MYTYGTSANTEDELIQRIAHLEEEVGKLTALLERSTALMSRASLNLEVDFPGPSRDVVLEQRLGNALYLAERLTEQRTIARFDQLLLVSEMAPDLFALLKGIGEDIIGQIPPEGLNLDERMRAITALAARLTEPNRVERLNHLIDLFDSAPELLEAVGGAFRDMMAQAPPEGLRIDERMQAILPILDRLSSPEMAKKLGVLLDLVEAAPDLAHSVQGMASDVLAQFPPEGLRLDERVQAVLPLLDKLTDPRVTQKLHLMLKIMEHMPELEFAPDNVFIERAAQCEIDLGRILHLVSATGSAFCLASKEPRRRMGLLGMLRAPLDHDRQVAIDFLMTFLKKLGQKL